MNRDSSCRFALLTPVGAGAIAAIRLCGPGVNSILQACMRSAGGSTPSFKSGRPTRGVIFDGDEVLDDVIACFVPSAAEPVVDVFTHGGVRVVERILELFTNLGGKRVDSVAATSLAWPARTEIEREAVELLVRAKTQRGVRFLAYQRRCLAAAIAAIAEKWSRDSTGASHDLQSISSNFTNARRLLGGVTVAIVGRPNAGKSTLFNRLAGRPAAVVSDRAGTTRDWVTHEIELHGHPITLIDTAGQCEGQDDLENAAVRAGRDVARNADLLLHVVDATEISDQPIAYSEREPGQPILIVLNKIDLIAEGKDLPMYMTASGPPEFVVPVSAVNGRGTDELFRCVANRLGFEDPGSSRPCLFTDRQMHLAQKVLSDASLPFTDVCRLLGEIIGETSLKPVNNGI